MKRIECEKCGSTDFTEQDGMYVCEFCGSKYPIQINNQAETVFPKQEEIHADGNVNGKNSGNSDQNTVGSSENVLVKSPKKWGPTFVLCILFGFLGFHRFYARKIGTGLLWLFTFGLFGIGWIVDTVLVAMGKFKDGQGRVIVSKRAKA